MTESDWRRRAEPDEASPFFGVSRPMGEAMNGGRIAAPAAHVTHIGANMEDQIF